MWHPVKQNSDDPCPCCGKTWMQLRAGKVTGSTIGCVMANIGKDFGDPAKRLAVDIAVVELGGLPTPNDYKNGHMERGHEQEPIARQLYAEEYFSEVLEGGFYDNGFTGCSPDGLVYNDGLVQIKSVINSRHYECVARKSFDPSYKWQLIFELKESKRNWTDYVSYCSTFPQDSRLFVCRIKSQDVQQEFSAIDSRLKEFRALVNRFKSKIGG